MGRVQMDFALRVFNETSQNVRAILGRYENYFADMKRVCPEDWAEWQVLNARIKELWDLDDGASLKEFRTVILKERDLLVKTARKLRGEGSEPKGHSPEPKAQRPEPKGQSREGENRGRGIDIRPRQRRVPSREAGADRGVGLW